MAGGKGTRLQPYTAVFPKPLMPLGDMPVIELLLHQLRSAGVTEVILAVNHLHHLIRAFCGDGSRFGLKIDYSLEDSPLGTAGPLGAIIDQIDDNFIVTNGDLLTTLDIGRMVATHHETGADASVGLYEREIRIDFGLVETDEQMRLVGYREKPTYKHLVSMGLYVLKPSSVRPYLRPNVHLDMPDLVKILVAGQKHVQCYKQENCFWLDIGRPDDYAQAQKMFADERQLFLPE